ncbi:unnamed protein product [Phyllotreta striolata]|uniref:Delta(24)-sterol reductase n=1 Tax=Phyllotreta striolata TaxID=444603 RepID=A0A9N9TTX9_PHYSR|nr:unnamed protein product [Phyllotreta striolata]
MGCMEYVLVNYRWLFVCFFLLPISLFYDLWMYFRNWVVFRLSSAPSKHYKKVKYVQEQIVEWNNKGRKTKMCSARPGWQTVSFRRPVYKQHMTNIDVNLVDILEIDTEKGVVRLEPLVSMGQLTATLNPLGWTIPVLPEIDDLTVGGLVMGQGIESSSHVHGLFQNTCVSYELVLSDGAIVRCSAKNEPDLFYSIPWSYGTLGILTAVEIRIVPAKKYVKLSYEPVWGLDNIVQKFTECSGDASNEFVEMILFSQHEAVMMTGVQTNSPEHSKINSIDRWYKPWFFKYVQEKLRNNTITEEYIPLRAYYHRHTRSIFWELQDIIPFGNNAVFRALLGWLIPPKISLLKLTQTKAIKELYERSHVFQDVLVPVGEMEKSLRRFHELVDVYPVWLCPFLLPDRPGMVRPRENRSEMFVDIGLYGTPRVDGFDPKETARKIEQHVIDSNGFQMLYADIYMTREEFRTMFDHGLYDKLRSELRCEDAFPEVYDKVSRAARD